MTMGVLTRWELTPQEKFEAFYSELLDYLRQHLFQVPRFPDAPQGELLWVSMNMRFTRGGFVIQKG